MKLIAGCLLSAVLGASFVLWMNDSTKRDFAYAQDRRGPNFPLESPEYDPAPAYDPPAAHPHYDAEGLTPDEVASVAVYENNNKGVVNITTRATEGFFLVDVTSEGAGSGSIIDKQGHVLTNYHVVEGSSEIGVTLYDGKTYDAELVGQDAIDDIAVLKIDAPPEVLFPLQLGDSSRLRVGMRVFAIGNPFGLERTMTTGIISSLNRTLKIRSRSIKSIIQIDAAVNPGNSGGPLLDSHGRLIGVNTAIATKTGQNSGVGFAIPINLVARVVPQLIEHGRFIRPEIGILQVYETDEGLLIATITEGGPAEKAGLRGPRLTRQRRGPFVIERMDRSAADMITEADGEKIETADDLFSYIESKQPGDRITLTVVRDGKTARVPVTLSTGESDAAALREK